MIGKLIGKTLTSVIVEVVKAPLEIAGEVAKAIGDATESKR